MNVRGHQVGVSLVDVPCEAWEGVESLPTQPAGEGVTVHQGSVGLQTGNILESSLTNLALQGREGWAAGAVQQAGDGVGGLGVWI